jgi:hypothetical protein
MTQWKLAISIGPGSAVVAIVTDATGLFKEPGRHARTLTGSRGI